MANKYICGVPNARCSGGTILTNSSIGGGTNQMKAHSDPVEAFKCHKKMLLDDGWKQRGSREFSPPGGGPIKVLTKQSKFGTRLRMGKNQEGKGSRYMPYSGGGFIHSS